MRRALPLILLLAAGCGDHRKPLPRGDGGPSVVLVDRRASDLAGAPSTPEIEPNDTIKEAMPLLPDARVGGAIGPGAPADVDCYALRASPVDLGAGGVDGGEEASVLGFVVLEVAERAEPAVLELLDARGRVAITRGVSAGRARLSYLGVTGAQVVRVRRAPSKTPAAAAISYTLGYTIEVARAGVDPSPEIEPNNDPAHANALPASGALIGRFDGSDDRDLIALPSLPDGATYRVELTALPELAPELRVRVGGAARSTARTGKGGELRLRNLPGHAEAPMFLELRAVDGGSDAPYTLRVASEPPIDASIEHEPNDDRAHANSVVAGDVLSGYLWPGDVDWFCVGGDAPMGARIDAIAEIDWKLELTDAAGKTVSKVDAGKRGAAEVAEPDPRARCVRMSARTRDTVFDAPYRLTVLPVP